MKKSLGHALTRTSYVSQHCFSFQLSTRHVTIWFRFFCFPHNHTRRLVSLTTGGTQSHIQRQFTFASHIQRLPNYLTDLFTKCENDNNNLRSNISKLSQLKPKTNFLKSSFSYRAAKAWNELPNKITDNFENVSIPSLKWRLKSAHS